MGLVGIVENRESATSRAMELLDKVSGPRREDGSGTTYWWIDDRTAQIALTGSSIPPESKALLVTWTEYDGFAVWRIPGRVGGLSLAAREVVDRLLMCESRRPLAEAADRADAQDALDRAGIEWDDYGGLLRNPEVSLLLTRTAVTDSGREHRTGPVRPSAGPLYVVMDWTHVTLHKMVARDDRETGTSYVATRSGNNLKAGDEWWDVTPQMVVDAVSEWEAMNGP